LKLCYQELIHFTAVHVNLWLAFNFKPISAKSDEFGISSQKRVGRSNFLNPL